MKGMPKVNFPVTTKKPKCQAFFNQGLGQLHGFWNLEAERSFRQAAVIDPACAMAYWGMARANLGNEKRAKGFIAEAVNHARAEGASRLLLGVYQGNERALAFYERMGFDKIGTRQFDVGGRIYDDWVLALGV